MFIEFSYAISPQKTYDESCFLDSQAINYTNNQLQVIEPKYNEAIPLNLLRRMGRAVRLGVGGAMEMCIKNNLQPNAIIFSSAVGGLEDCIKFLNQIYVYEEGTLTPTNFVQSTPNAIAGSLALLTKNSSYNTTHVNGANSFLDALLDAQLLMNEGKTSSCLLGCVEEISSYNYNINQLAGLYKDTFISSLDLLKTKSKGSICGEGAAMFYLSPHSQNYEAEIISFFTIQKNSSADEILEEIESMLNKENLEKNAISDLILGYNGDQETQQNYDSLSLFFENSNIYAYKHLTGEYPTSVSFALWMGIKLFKNKELPLSCIKKVSQNIREYVLIYNHYNSKEHSILLLKKGTRE
ncbi:MAG: beta-ketoacyl synthase chain length factor [Flavobacteriia bacterium]|nr:beta-ketoacyl synthase chain length factor [Flavobacteriia bacterium]